VTVAELLPRTHADQVVLDGRFMLDCQVSERHGVSLWRATDQILRRPVAVHLLPAWTPVPPGLTQAVQASARVNDTRLAPIFDISLNPECPCIISEWARDPNLEDLLLTGLPDPSLAAFIVAEAADAISAAHAGGRPHLRLGLRSLHWGSSGLKITGLGIDAALSGADPADSARADATRTDTARTDTEALTRILYALLTGCWPGDEAAALRPARRTRAGLCEPRQLSAGVPAILNAIICQALPGQPAWGQASIRTPDALAAALRAARPAVQALVPPPRLPRTAPHAAPETAPRGNARHARGRTDAGRRPSPASCFSS
jgi:hypothetical protein